MADLSTLRPSSSAAGCQSTGQAHPNAHTVQALFDAAVCFFVPFLAASPTGASSAIDVFSLGTTVTICMLGVVTMEIMIVARYWTWWFAFVCILSYALVYPFVLVFPIIQESFDFWVMAHYGIGVNIMRTRFFWIVLVTVYATTFSIRYLERSAKWLFRPDDNMIRAELEFLNHRNGFSSSLHDDDALDVDFGGLGQAMQPSAPRQV
jgi:hypothetical protein